MTIVHIVNMRGTATTVGLAVLLAILTGFPSTGEAQACNSHEVKFEVGAPPTNVDSEITLYFLLQSNCAGHVRSCGNAFLVPRNATRQQKCTALRTQINENCTSLGTLNTANFEISPVEDNCTDTFTPRFTVRDKFQECQAGGASGGLSLGVASDINVLKKAQNQSGLQTADYEMDLIYPGCVAEQGASSANMCLLKGTALATPIFAGGTANVTARLDLTGIGGGTFVVTQPTHVGDTATQVVASLATALNIQLIATDSTVHCFVKGSGRALVCIQPYTTGVTGSIVLACQNDDFGFVHASVAGPEKIVNDMAALVDVDVPPPSCQNFPSCDTVTPQATPSATEWSLGLLFMLLALAMIRRERRTQGTSAS